MIQMNRKKNHSTDQKMSPNETSATITVSSLSRWAERNKPAAAGDTLRQATVNPADRRSRMTEGFVLPLSTTNQPRRTAGHRVLLAWTAAAG